MFVAALILRSTVGVLRETLLVLMDSVPEGIDYPRVGRALAAIHGVQSVHDLHIWSMVPGRGALSAHVRVDDSADWPRVLRQARAMLRRDFGIDHVTLQPEWLHRGPRRRRIDIKPAA
jgi:cobalt-zinc-cadmium efflux system protein